MKQYIFLGILSFFVGIALFLNSTAFAAQTYSKTICHHTPAHNVTLTFHTPQAYAGHLGQPHSQSTFDTNGACAAPTPTQVPTATPTNIPTLAPTTAPTPTGTKDCEPGEISFLWFHWDTVCEPTLTPTPVPSIEPSVVPTEPEATPSAETTPTTPETTVSNGSSDASTPTCATQINAPLLQGVERTSATSVKFSWWPVAGVDKYAIIYGYDESNLNFGQATIANDQTNITLNNLKPDTNVFAQVWAYKGGCISKSANLSSVSIPKGAPATGRGN